MGGAIGSADAQPGAPALGQVSNLVVNLVVNVGDLPYRAASWGWCDTGNYTPKSPDKADNNILYC